MDYYRTFVISGIRTPSRISNTLTSHQTMGITLIAGVEQLAYSLYKITSNTSLMKYLVLLLTLCIPAVALSQKVYSVEYANQADIKVHVVKYENQCDLKVYKVDYSNQTQGNKGLWYFVEYANQAAKKIYFVEYANQSDLKIYFVKYRNQAGWRNMSKKHLMY